MHVTCQNIEFHTRKSAEKKTCLWCLIYNYVNVLSVEMNVYNNNYTFQVPFHRPNNLQEIPLLRQLTSS